MKISIIAAASELNVIGVDNHLPWNLPDDTSYYLEKIKGHPIILGRKSFEANGGPIKGSTNIIVTSDRTIFNTGVLVATTIIKALDIALNLGDEEIFITGGASIYKSMLPYTNKLYLTRIFSGGDIVGDSYFPSLCPDEWKLECSRFHSVDERHQYPFVFNEFSRIKNQLKP